LAEPLHRKQESASFWKKKQKLLQIWARVEPNVRPNLQKFFGSFFQKRTACFYFTEGRLQSELILFSAPFRA
jgi:hypothetical protein